MSLSDKYNANPSARTNGPKVINRYLYSMLSQRIGKVSVANEGECAHFGTPHMNVSTGKLQSSQITAGEYYKLDCIYCGDTRQRLWVNHRWGCLDQISGEPMWHLAICYNCDCLKTHFHEFREQVFGFMNDDERGSLAMMRLTVRTETDEKNSVLSPVGLPGKIIPINKLPRRHPAVLYLRDRKFDLDELAIIWDVGYCDRADPAYLPAEDRIIAPITVNDDVVGWQGRYVGETNWNRDGIAKYYTMPGFPKRRVLYNRDLARGQPFVVAVEGVTDVWAVGMQSVALLGKTISPAQRDLLSGWASNGGVLILMLDPEAWTSEQSNPERAKEKHEQLMDDLNARFNDRVVEIQLPSQRDAASLGRRSVQRIIRDQVRAAGFKAPRFPE